MLEPFEALQATDEVGEAGQNGSIAMAVDEIAQLGVARDPRDAEGRGQVVGLEFALKATLELQQRTVLDVKTKRQRSGNNRAGCSELCSTGGCRRCRPRSPR